MTVPHKETAYAIADEREASARAVQAANTLWIEGGKLWAANTDTYGFMTYLDHTVPDWKAHDGPACVLGAGGAARAIVHGFLEAGLSEVRVFNRARPRAEALADELGPRVKVFEWGNRIDGAREACVLVNATSAGLKGAGSLGMDFAGFNPDCVVCDIVYVPLETQLLGEARAHGLRTVDGLGMLLHQAVPGFERWFGVRPQVTDKLRAILVADIEGRTC